MKQILAFCEKYAPEILVLLLCLPAVYGMRNFASYHDFFYFTDYSTGFGGKKFLGEICSLWLPDVVRKRHLLFFIVGIKFIMVGLFSYLCGICINQNKENKFAYILLLVVYLLSPYSFYGVVYGAHVDFLLVTITLLFLLLFIKCRDTWYYYLLTLILLCCACLTHHIFCNIYFPLIFALFIYDVFFNGGNKKKKIILYFIISLCLIGLFCAILFFSSMNVDFETYYQYLQTRTESINLSSKPALYYEYYATLSEHISAYVIPMWKFHCLHFFISFLVLSPLLAIFWTPWIMAIKNARTKTEKWGYTSMQLALHLLIFPAYIMAVDYERWTYAYFFCQFCLLMTICYKSKTNLLKVSVDRLISFANQYKVCALIICIYICSLGLVTSATGIPWIEVICSKCGLCWQVNELVPTISM